MCDDTFFPRFFRRVLNRDYARFRQLLRIEPGIAKYDWLVQQYKESQVYGIDETEGDKTSTTSVTASKEIAQEDDVTDTKSDTTVHSDARTETRVEDVDTIRTPNLLDSYSGSVGTIIGETVDATTDSTTDTTAGSSSVQKTNPQSISYAGATAGEVPDLEWEYPGAQAQDKSSSLAESESTSTTERQSETTETDQNTTARTGTETTAQDGTTTITHGGRLTEESSESGTQSRESSVSETDESESDFSERHTGKAESLRQSIDSGRGEAPAEILSRAARYIKNSSAIGWLIGQLEPCFIGIYEV